jgi:hypothetical protein
MQLCAGVRAEANYVAGVRWNFGMNEDDMEHSA